MRFNLNRYKYNQQPGRRAVPARLPGLFSEEEIS